MMPSANECVFQSEEEVPVKQSLEDLALIPPVDIPAVARECFLRDSRAWLNKWSKVHVAIAHGVASWATCAQDAVAALAPSGGSSKAVTRVSIKGCEANALANKLDGRANALRLKLASGAEVRNRLHSIHHCACLHACSAVCVCF